MAGYIVRLIETYGLEVYSNVIYLRPDAGRRDPGQFVQNIAGHEVLTRYKVFRLIEIDGQSILETKPMGLLPFTPLMKRPKEVSAEAWLRRCVQTADSVNVENKTAYLGTLAVLGSLVYEPETIVRRIVQTITHTAASVPKSAPPHPNFPQSTACQHRPLSSVHPHRLTTP